MDDRPPPLRSVIQPAHIRMRAANDDAPIQPYRPSLLRQPDDPGVEEEAERTGTHLALGVLALAILVVGLAAWSLAAVTP